MSNLPTESPLRWTGCRAYCIRSQIIKYIDSFQNLKRNQKQFTVHLSNSQISVWKHLDHLNMNLPSLSRLHWCCHCNCTGQTVVTCVLGALIGAYTRSNVTATSMTYLGLKSSGAFPEYSLQNKSVLRKHSKKSFNFLGTHQKWGSTALRQSLFRENVTNSL